MRNSVKKKSTASKRKRSGRFNIIDLFLVLIALALVAALLYIFAPFSTVKNLISSEKTTMEYTVEFVGVDKTFVNKIQKNDIVVDAVSKNHIGTVEAADYNYAYTQFESIQKGDAIEGVLVEHPDKCNVIVTISAEATHVPGKGYSVNQYRIAVGEKMNLIFPNYMGECYCIDLSVDS